MTTTGRNQSFLLSICALFVCVNLASAQPVHVTGTLVVDEDTDLPTTGGMMLDGGTLQVIDDATFTATQYAGAAATNQLFTAPSPANGTIDIAPGKTLTYDGTYTSGGDSTIYLADGNFWPYIDPVSGTTISTRSVGDLDLIGGGTLEMTGDTRFGGWIDAGTGVTSRINVGSATTLRATYSGSLLQHDRMVHILDGGTFELHGADIDQSASTVGSLYGGGTMRVLDGKVDAWGWDRFSLTFEESCTAANPGVIDVVASDAYFSVGSNQTQGGLASAWIEVADAPGTTGQAVEKNDLYPVAYLEKTGDGVFNSGRGRFWLNKPHDSLKTVWDVKEGTLSTCRKLGGSSNLGWTAADRKTIETAWTNPVDPYRGFHRSHVEGLTVRDGARLEWAGTHGFFDDSWWKDSVVAAPISFDYEDPDTGVITNFMVDGHFPLSAGDGWNASEFVIETGAALGGGAPTENPNLNDNFGKQLTLGLEDVVDGVFLAYPTITNPNGKSTLDLFGGINFRSGINLDSGTPLLDITVNNGYTKRTNLAETPGGPTPWRYVPFASNKRVIDFSNDLTGAMGVDVFQTLDIQTGGVRIRNTHANVTMTTVAAAGPDVLLGYDSKGNPKYQTQDPGLLEFQADGGPITYSGAIANDGLVRAAAGDTTVEQIIGTGSIEIVSGATLRLSETIANLSSAGSATIDGTLDVDQGGILIGGTDEVSIRALVKSDNIISTTAAGQASYAVGYALVGSDVKVQYALKGDANLDQLVDAGDIGILLTNFGATDAVWSDADFNEDDLVDASDVGDLLTNFTGDPGPAPAGSVVAEYDPATGEIIVSVDGVLNWLIEATDGSAVMTGDPAANLPSGGGLVTDNDFRVGESNFGGTMTYTDVNLGNVAVTGLVQGDLIAKWQTGFGAPTEQIEVVVIPEPASLMLLGLGGMLMLRRRRAA